MSSHPKHRARRPLLGWKALAAFGVAASLAAGGVVVSGFGAAGDERVGRAVKPPAPSSEVVDVAREEVVSRPIDVDRVVDEARARAKEPLPDLSNMTLPELQTYAVKMQTEFVQASLAYETAKTESEQARVTAVEARSEAEHAQLVADEAKGEFRRTLISSYQAGDFEDPGTQMLAGSVEDLDELLADRAALSQVHTLQEADLDALTTLRDEAESLQAVAEEAESEALDAQSDAEFLLDDIQGRASKVAAAANAALAGSGSAGDLFASAEQRARNSAALRSWRSYLALLEAAKVVPPSAAQLRRPDRLPRGLSPLLGRDGEPVAGVAAVRHKSRTVTVLARETIGAVSRAFASVGKPYVEGLAGPETYDCSGLVSAVWSPAGFEVSAAHPVTQFETTRRVPVRDAQTGDLVFFADEFGVQHVGLNLGGNLMLTSDGDSMQVGVQPFPKRAFAVTRVSLGLLKKSSRNTAPATDVASWSRCGGESLDVSDSGMAYPLKAGSFTFSATFGQKGSLWSSGYHTGLDFSARAGTPVLAAKAGEVRVEKSDWAGPNHVVIDHGDGLRTSYAHMQRATVKTGDVVQAGALIGAVGSLGNSTGPHLHFETIVDEVKVDPMLFLSQGSDGRGWGGFTNGMIPEARMCGLKSAPGHMLRCDAAAAWEAMARAYRSHFGNAMCITDSYRSYAVQVTTYANKPGLAAVPGTSNHGWALAVDLCGGINSFGTRQFLWMVKNAPRFGWVHPGWARQGGGREEPWHWEFGEVS